MVGVATIIVWLMLALFISTAVYSATLLEVDFEEPQFYILDKSLILAFPIKINNRGYYALEDFTLVTEILYRNETIISSQETYVELIPAGKPTLILHNITFDVNSLTSDLSRLLFEDTNLTVINRVKLNFTSLLPVRLHTNTSFPWGAPLYNFTVTDFSLQPHNSTHSQMSFHVSFQNHAFFSLTGKINIKVFDKNDALMDELAHSLNVPSGSSFSGLFELYFENMELPSGGRIELFVESDTFTCGPWVFPLEY